ncbi:MAG: tRNA pseudouridine(55) synthase TruB [Clostridiales bacterium]|nr:tRNA pseudouridine(55) synthase TruB [Clostridiales bacterium]
MTNGIVNLLKPPGMSSRQAVSAVRRMMGEKAGHAGTLDPEACGVLPIMVGRATRLFDYIADQDKQYLAELCFGAATDTQDAQGNVVAVGNCRPDEADIRQAMTAFIGDVLQTPPAYSAIKIGGKRAYDLARGGTWPAIEARPIRIDSIDYVAGVSDSRHLIRVVCGKGTYIRTLCHDIGRALCCPAHMSFLLRERTGVFRVDEAMTLEEVQSLAEKRVSPDSWMMDMGQVLGHILPARVKDSYEKLCRNGGALPPGAVDLSDEPAEGRLYRMYCSQTLVCISAFADGYFRVRTYLA